MLSSVLAQTIGKAANWTTFFPTHEVASEAFVSLPSELQGYLVQRHQNTESMRLKC